MKKISWREKLVMRLLPYWCPNCKARFHKERQFQKHYFPCEHRRRLAIQEHEERVAERLAPSNRAGRRKLAKKMGQIKDWGKLNG